MNPVSLNSAQNRFELETHDQIAVAEFVLRPGTIVVTHVIVPPSLRGGGIASALGAAIVAHARREKLQIVPQCPFMAAYLQKHPESV